MELNNKLLSDITIFTKYAKYNPKLKRRETWDEICDRYEYMMVNKYPKLSEEIQNAIIYIREKKVLPSMRALQFAGPAIWKNNARIYNCAYLPIDDYRAFSETMFLLLSGCGVGYSVQYHHIDQLPVITKPEKTRKFLISDNIEGWADAVKVLIKSYMGYSNSKPIFDFSDIREKGAKLVTAGGKAPGPEPLKLCLAHIEAILERKKDGEKLKPIEVHDILCHIANAPLAGGIRRAAMIALFSPEDEEMMTCKYGNYWEFNEQRGRANNSVVLERDKITHEQFFNIWNKIQASGTGEPGIYWTNNKDWGTNPCCEIALRPFQFCNLVEINRSNIESQEDLNNRSDVVSFLGTLQAGFTDFHYLRDIWRRTTEKEALIGVGQTGIASNRKELNLEEASNIVIGTNKKTAEIIGINSAARTTTIKPSGTTSCVLGCSSGIHGYHNDYYIRRLRFNKNESIYKYIIYNNPNLVEDDYFRPQTQAIVSIPQKAPKDSTIRTETALDLLERVKYYNLNWVKKGHISGDNTNNVSATISIGDTFYYWTEIHKDGKKYLCNSEICYPWEGELYESLNEWQMVGKWMWQNRDTFNGLSILPYDGGKYIQAPFEDITKERYEELISNIKDIDLSKVVEEDDLTTFTQEAACGGGSCELNY